MSSPPTKKLRLVMSGPLICRKIQSDEKDIYDSSKSFPALERKSSGDTDGLKIAFWALRMRSVTSDFSAMVSPNCISLVLLSTALVNRKETLHVHGASEWVSWHFVGHLISYIEVLGTRHL